MFKKQGFTIIELVMVLVILGILAAVAIPRYFNLQTQAQQNAEAGVVGAVRAGIATYYANECAGGACAWPAALDDNDGDSCDNSACFENVLEQGGITDANWSRGTGTHVYTGPTGTTYTYTPANGSFLE